MKCCALALVAKHQQSTTMSILIDAQETRQVLLSCKVFNIENQSHHKTWNTFFQCGTNAASNAKPMSLWRMHSDSLHRCLYIVWISSDYF